MRINQFTSATPNLHNNNNYPAFSGRVIAKGKWTKELKDAFLSSPAIKELASGNKDVIGRLISTTAKKNDYNHTWGEPLFKLSLEMRSSKPSLKEKMQSMLGISRKVINRYFHSEDSMSGIITNLTKKGIDERMAKNLKK